MITLSNISNRKVVLSSVAFHMIAEQVRLSVGLEDRSEQLVSEIIGTAVVVTPRSLKWNPKTDQIVHLNITDAIKKGAALLGTVLGYATAPGELSAAAAVLTLVSLLGKTNEIRHNLTPAAARVCILLLDEPMSYDNLACLFAQSASSSGQITHAETLKSALDELRRLDCIAEENGKIRLTEHLTLRLPQDMLDHDDQDRC